MNVHLSTRAHRARVAIIGAAALGGAFLPAVGLGASSALAVPLCTLSAGVVTCTYSTPGADTFTVPAGATSLTVTADGASGANDNVYNGGLGGEAQATLTGAGLTGATLHVYVGMAGSLGSGGANSGGNGGAGLTAGGGGGAASYVSAGPSTLVVGGGGGGAAVANNGGNGGTSASTAGAAGAPGTGLLFPGGLGGTTLAGGAGGTTSLLACSTAATAGLPLLGGNGATGGASTCFGGGGGGGGYFGGGGGGSTPLLLSFGGGGGGGSAFPASPVTLSSILVTPSTSDGSTNTGSGQVTISYPQIATTSMLTSSLNPSNSGASVTFTATISPTDGSGTVEFKNGASDISGCSARTLTLVSGSTYQATCTTSSLPGGTNSITAVYSGDTSYLTSTSNTLSQLVSVATSTTITSSPNPSSVGQSVTFTATVSPTDGLGTVTFTDTTTSTVLCNAVSLTLVGTSYQATCMTSSLTAGDHTIEAAYTGDVGYGASSDSLTQYVRKIHTDLSASIYFNAGQTFTVTATLTSHGSPVSGQPVSFSTGAHHLCTATTNTSGVARCVLTGSQTLLVEENNYTITADFSGTATYYPSFATAHISMFP